MPAESDQRSLRASTGSSAFAARGRRWRLLLWAAVAALVGVQAVWSAHSTEILRFEEVAESVRNAWWLRHGALYDGISTNLGWYGLLLALYEAVGFGPFAATWVRLGLHAVALACLAVVLRRYLGSRRALLPLVTIGLSPAVLFLNTLQTSFGLDLVYFAVCLALVTGLPRGNAPADAGARILLGAVAMVAWMSYPVFLFYLPALGWIYLRQPGRPGFPAEPPPRSAGVLGGPYPGFSARAVGLAGAGFLAPLAAALAWVDEPGRLLYDPGTGSGIFRGGGTGFGASVGEIVHDAAVALGDLFLRGSSYYFWVEHPDLSGLLGIASTIGLTAAGAALLLRRGRWTTSRAVVLLAVLLPAANLLVVSAGSGPAGLRRATALVAGIYALHAVLWREAGGAGSLRGLVRWIALAACVALPVHHLVWALPNLLEVPLAGEQPGEEQNHLWLAVEPTADEALERWLEHTAAGRPLDCREIGLEPERCQYGGIYALLAGYRTWNDLPPVPLRGYSYEEARVVPLSVERLSGEFSRPAGQVEAATER